MNLWFDPRRIPEYAPARNSAQVADGKGTARPLHSWPLARLRPLGGTRRVRPTPIASIDDDEKAVAWAISLGGDTDTNAAVVGALLGCRHGVDAIPARWLGALRERKRIEQVAEALAQRAEPA